MVWTSSITMPIMVGIMGCALAVDEKVWFFCLFVSHWNYKVCDNGNTMKQYYYQNNYGVVACRKVCSCAPILDFFCGPQKFFHTGNLYQKLRFLRFLPVVGPHFKSQNVKFGMTVWTCDSLHQAIFCENRLRGNKFIPKITNFGDFGGCKPTFKEWQRWNLAWVYGPGTPSAHLIL